MESKDVSKVQQAAHEHAKENENIVGSFNIARENAFIAGAAWAKERASAEGVAASDPAIMRMLGSIENRLMELAEISNQSFLGVRDRLNGFRDRFDIQSQRQHEINAAVVDVGQKVEAVLTQAVSNGELIEAVHGLVAEPPIENVCVDDAHSDVLADSMAHFTRANPLKTDAAMKERLTMGVDLAKPGSDTTQHVFRNGGTVVYGPKDAGDFVDMINFNGVVIIAYQKGVFRMAGDRLIPLRFVAE